MSGARHDDLRLAAAARRRESGRTVTVVGVMAPGVRVADPGVWTVATLAVLAAGVGGAAGPVRRALGEDPARVLGLS